MQGPLLLVLVVEDDHFIKELVKEALSEGGFESKIVSSGEEAVALLRDGQAALSSAPYRREFAGRAYRLGRRQARQRTRPGYAVVYMTGAAADQWPSHGVPNSALLQKPFAPAQVVTAISQLLNQAPPT